MNKNQIRLRVRTSKTLLSDDERHEAARRVFNRLERMASFMMADNILIYHSLDDELPTHAFIDKWHSRKHFFLPRVAGVNLELLPYNPSTLSEGAFHIQEPTEGTPLPVSAIDLIIVPGVAFDRKGNRVGRGRGFYDRLLADAAAHTIGVGYDFQLIEDEVETVETDIPVHVVITPSNTFRCRRK